MTVYEQIQKSLDYIEANLFRKLTYERAADSANMSFRSFYNYFWMITGYTYKEYVKKRRLNEAMKILLSSEEKVLNIALDIGYESHEAFTRAFKNEFGVSPFHFRKSRQELKGLEKIKLIKEMYMGVIVKELPEMRVACFEGYAPDPENKAHAKMVEWLKANGLSDYPRRVFGHNIDLQGNLSYEPENEGYKVMVTIDQNKKAAGGNVKFDVIKSGKFVVTGIEGNFETDKSGRWIMDGWQKMNNMVCEKGYKIKQPVRYFEEELEPSKPGNLRLDLYLEIE
jgi:AraC family transcriptional regulator